jgi:hypothetical protein
MKLLIAKKFVQVLSCDGVLKRFFPKTGDDQVLKLVKETFAQMWGLEKDDETTRIVIQVNLTFLYKMKYKILKNSRT